MPPCWWKKTDGWTDRGDEVCVELEAQLDSRRWGLEVRAGLAFSSIDLLADKEVFSLSRRKPGRRVRTAILVSVHT